MRVYVLSEQASSRILLSVENGEERLRERVVLWLHMVIRMRVRGKKCSVEVNGEDCE